MRITDNLLIGLGIGLLLLTADYSFASQASGLIKDITVTNNILGANSVKIKIYSARKNVASDAPCEKYSTGGTTPVSYYAFAMPDNDSQSKAWFSQLQIAKALGKTVIILGSATCADPYYEETSAITNQ